MLRKSYHFRERLSPWALEAAQNYMETMAGNFIRDITIPGVIGSALPVALSPGTWELEITPPVIVYTDTGMRLYIDRRGIIDMSACGDLLPEEYGTSRSNAGASGIPVLPMPTPGSGEEVWLSLGVRLCYKNVLPAVDGYGNNVHLAQKLTFQFRIVYGAIAPQGAAFRPDKSNFSGGALLADVLIRSGDTCITPAHIYYDRTDRFAFKSAVVLYSGAQTGTALRFGSIEGSFPLEILQTPPGQWFDRLTFPPALANGVLVIRTELLAPLTRLPATGTTTIQFSRVATFDAGDEYTVFLTDDQVYRSSDQSFYIEPPDGEQIYVRCIGAGGHRWVKWRLTYAVA